MSDGAKPNRRLPVIGGAPADPGDVERPAWQLVAITAGATLLVWILLASIVNAALGSRATSAEPDPLVTALHSAAFFVSAGAAGALARRVGAHTGRRAVLTGASLAAALGWAVPFGWWISTGGGRSPAIWIVLLIAMAATASLASALGFRLAVKRTAKPPE